MTLQGDEAFPMVIKCCSHLPPACVLVCSVDRCLLAMICKNVLQRHRLTNH